MNRISFKKIAIAFFVILLMSKSRRILDALSGLDGGGILTLEPLRQSSELQRYIATMAILFLCFIILWHLFLRRR
jgi:preprotein translocase subunit SecG